MADDTLPTARLPEGEGIHEEALRELLRSPLDDEPHRPRSGAQSGRGRAALLFLAAAAVGAGSTVLGASLADGGAAEPAATTAGATPLELGPALPAGYSPLGDGYGARVERILRRTDGVFITISTAVDEEHAPATTPGHQGGQWVLESADGSTMASTTVAFDPIAPGMATIVFPAFDFDRTTADLRLVAIDEPYTATYSARVSETVAALPVAGTVSLEVKPLTFTLEGGGRLRLSSLDLGPRGATLHWTVEGAGVTAHVAPTVLLEGATTVVLVPSDPFFPFRNRLVSIPPPALASSGRVALIPSDSTHSDPGPVVTVSLTFEVTWAVSRSSDATLPLDGVGVVEVDLTR